jgi:hypothetical protein
MRFFWVSLLVVAGSVLVACGTEFTGSDGGGGTTASGTGGTGTGGTGTGGTASSSSGIGGSGAGCEQPEVPVPVVPSGWIGPAVIATADTDALPACPPGALDNPVVKGELSSPPLDCQCLCGTPHATACAVSLNAYNVSCSGSAVHTFNLDHNSCVPLTNVTVNTLRLRWQTTTPGESACEASAGTPTITEPIWHKYVQVCPMPKEPCLDPPPGSFVAAFCIYQEGETDCPTGPYAMRSVYHTGYEDGRSCADDCGCSGASVTCEGTVNLYGDQACGDSAETLAAGVCGQPANPVAAVEYVASPSGGCTATGGATEGGVEATGPVTFCCTG